MPEETIIYIVLNEQLKEMDDWRTLNVSTMLGQLIGNQVDSSCFGPAVTDASGVVHAGLGNVVLPILAIKGDQMLEFYKKAKEKEKEASIKVFDFSLCAQNSHVYKEYQEKLQKKSSEEQTLLGVAVVGAKKASRSLCGSLARWK